MTLQIHGIDHLNIAALSAPPDVTARHPARAAFIDMTASPDDKLANAERGNGCAAHAIIAIRETCNKLAPTKE